MIVFFELLKHFIFYRNKYDNIFLMGDFNMAPENYPLKGFTNGKLIKEPAYLKDTSPTPINLLRNKKSVL